MGSRTSTPKLKLPTLASLQDSHWDCTHLQTNQSVRGLKLLLNSLLLISLLEGVCCMKTQHRVQITSLSLSKQLTSQKMRQCVSNYMYEQLVLVSPLPPLDQTILLTTINELETTLAASRMAAVFPFCACPLSLTQILAYLSQLTRHNSSFHHGQRQTGQPIDQLHSILQTVVSRGKVELKKRKFTASSWQVQK